MEKGGGIILNKKLSNFMLKGLFRLNFLIKNCQSREENISLIKKNRMFHKVITLFVTLTFILSSFGGWIPMTYAAGNSVTLSVENVTPSMVGLIWSPYASGDPNEAGVTYTVYRCDGGFFSQGTAQILQQDFAEAFDFDPEIGQFIWDDLTVQDNMDYSYQVYAEALDASENVIASTWSNTETVSVPYATVVGTVYDPDGITPIAMAKIIIHSTDYTFWQETDTLDDGSFALSTPDGDYVIEVWHPEGSPYGQTKTSVTVSYTGIPVDSGIITLPLANVFGTVYEPNGVTLVGETEVILRNNNWTLDFHGKTDLNGSFQFTAPQGDYILEAKPWDTNSPYTSSPQYTFTVGPDPVTGIQLVLSEPSVIGYVYDIDGITPVEDAQINIHTTDFSYASWSRSDKTGKFTFGGLPDGSYIVDVHPPTGSTSAGVTATVTVVSGELAQLSINLQAPSVTGTVYLPDGVTPAQHAWVNIYSASSDNPISKGTPTNLQGQYAIGGLDPGTYEMEVYPPWGIDGLVSYHDQVEVTETPPAIKNIIFPAAQKTIIIQVRDSENTPVTNAHVSAFRTDGYGMAFTDSGDVNGNYQLMVDAGSWEVNVAPPWNGTDVSWVNTGMPKVVVFDIDPENPQSANLTFTVTKATGTIQGQVNLNGVPANQVFVDARNAKGVGNGAPVDNSGNFQIKVPAGTYQLMVFVNNPDVGNPASRTVTVNDGQTVIISDSIDLPVKDKVLMGKVTQPDGSGIANVEVFAWQINGTGWANGQTDSNGDYNFKLTTGKWQVMVFPSKDSSYFYNDPPVDVNVSGSITTVNFALATADATLVGNIMNGGTLAASIRYGYVWLENAEGEFVSGAPIENGSFTLKAASGAYKLGVGIPPEFGFIADGTNINLVTGTNSVTISVTANDKSITGVVSSNGEPITGQDLVIYAVNDKGAYQQAVVDSTNGTYSLKVAAGTWHLGYYTSSETIVNEPLTNNSVTVNPGDVSVTKNISVRSANNTVTGTVYAGGSPVPGVMVFADNGIDVNGQPTTGKPYHTNAVTDADGNFTLQVPDGQYVIGTGITGELKATYLPPKLQAVSVSGGNTVSGVSVSFVQSDAQIDGQVTLGGSIPNGEVFVTAWSDSGAKFSVKTSNGSFSLKAKAGEKWYVAAVFEEDTAVYTGHGKITAVSGVNTLNIALTVNSLALPKKETVTFNAANPQILTLSDGTVIDIPAGAIAQTGTITLTATPTMKMPKETGNVPVGVGYDLKIFKNDNGILTEVKNFLKPIAITFKYDEAYLTDLGIDEDTLIPNYEDESNGKYQQVDRVVHNTADNTMTIYTTHFTLFTLNTNENTQAAPETPTNSNDGDNDSGGDSDSVDTTIPVPVEAPAINLKDVVNHWAQNNINKLVTLGAISGYPDGNFKPNSPITRAEFITVLVKALKLELQDGKVFDDTAKHWAKDYIATAAALGIVKGTSDQAFAPDEEITREQMAVMIVTALKLSGSGEVQFTDSTDVSDWASQAIAIASKEGLINGYSDNTFKPGHQATRAEAVTVITNALK